MRIMRTAAIAALLVLWASSSSAYRVDFASPHAGGTMGFPVGYLVTVDVYLDTEGQGDIALLGVGVLFDESVVTYRQDLSSTTTYLLYTTAKNPYLQPASTCGGGYGSPTAGQGCNTFLTRSNQVQLDFLSSGLPSGVPGTGVGKLVSLVFEVVSPGLVQFFFDFDPFYGSILQLGDTSNPPLGLGLPLTVGLVPEPSTALLVGLGLAVLGATRRRPRIPGATSCES